MAEELSLAKLKQLPTHSIVVFRRRFRLYLFERAGSVFQHPPVFGCRVAVGALGFGTPKGPHIVTRKECPPTYTAPNKQWALDAGYTPGEILPADDPNNPLRGAFLWVGTSGIGIHGTASLFSLGTRASHGCLRVREKDALHLYDTVPLGTHVEIV